LCSYRFLGWQADFVLHVFAKSGLRVALLENISIAEVAKTSYGGVILELARDPDALAASLKPAK
jgi:hypothetical protein